MVLIDVSVFCKFSNFISYGQEALNLIMLSLTLGQLLV